MPLDGNLSLPTLRMLSTILRDRRCWPKGFVWDYRACTTCAMGLAHQLFKEVKGPDHLAMSEVFKIPRVTTYNIFLGPRRYYGTLSRKDISPEMVADAIDSYLATTPEEVFTHAV